MTREQAKEILEKLMGEYSESEDDDDIEIMCAFKFALNDMESLQEILNITDGIITD